MNNTGSAYISINYSTSCHFKFWIHGLYNTPVCTYTCVHVWWCIKLHCT